MIQGRFNSQKPVSIWIKASMGSLAPTLPLFLAAMGLGGGIGVGLTGMTTHAALIADAYVRRRGLATGIAFGGSMAAYALAAPAQWIITHWGWRPAFWCYAAAIVALIPWVWRAHPTRLASVAARGTARPGETAVTASSIVRSAGFWSLLVIFTTPPLFGYLATTQHTLYFTDRGFTAGEASLLLAIGGVLAGGGRALAGLVADRFGGPTAGFLSFSCSLLGMLCLIAMEARPLWILAAGYVLFLFLPLGSRASIVTVLLSRIAPPAHYGFIFGLLGIGNNLGAALGPWLVRRDLRSHRGVSGDLPLGAGHRADRAGGADRLHADYAGGGCSARVALGSTVGRGAGPGVAGGRPLTTTRFCGFLLEEFPIWDAAARPALAGNGSPGRPPATPGPAPRRRLAKSWRAPAFAPFPLSTALLLLPLTSGVSRSWS